MINLLKDFKLLSNIAQITNGTIIFEEIKSSFAKDLLISSDDHIAQNITTFVPVNTEEDIELNIKIILKGTDSLNLRLYFLPQKDNFNITCNITAVTINHSNFSIITDTLVKSDINLNIDIPAKLNLREVTKGYVNVQENFLMFDESQIKSVPEFSILPGGIEQIHGMVIYSLDTFQDFFLRNRGIVNPKELFLYT